MPQTSSRFGGITSSWLTQGFKLLDTPAARCARRNALLSEVAKLHRDERGSVSVPDGRDLWFIQYIEDGLLPPFTYDFVVGPRGAAVGGQGNLFG